MQWLKNTKFAHRGLHKGFIVPENSYKAFKKAINKNYGIELDLRFTKDKKLVVFHDKNLLRLCASRKKIQNENYATLKTISLYKTKQKIPLFSDVLKLVDKKVPLIIEIKNYGKVGEFEEAVVKELENYRGDFAISSFNPEVIKYFKENYPLIKRGMIFGDIKKFNIRFYKTIFIYRYFKLKPDFVSLDYKLIDTYISSFCKSMNIPIVSWIINSKKKYTKAKMYVNNIIFENIKP